MASHYNCSATIPTRAVPADTRPRPPGVEPAVAPALAASQYNTCPIAQGSHGVAGKPVVPLLAPLRRLREVERPLDLKHRLAKRVTPDGKAKPAAALIHPAMLEETMPKDLQKRLSRRLVEGNKRYSYLQQDWNLLFQQTMELPSEQPHQRILKVQKLIQIHSEFVTVAEVLGRQIIEELNLPPEKRTITPEQGIGEAGGTKYILAGCFFKLQKDVRGLYGGEKYAMKATSAELRNMKAIYESGMEGLCMPLVAMIDYRGYRLLVTSVLPLGSTTQQWGSSDGGVTFSFNRDACGLVRRLGEKLHLKKHLLARPEQDIELYGPIDFEIHKGKDDARYYALDVARLMPPTAPHGQVHAVLVPQDVSRPLVQVYVHEEAGSWLKDALDKIQASEDEACVEEHEDSCTIVVYKPEFTPRTSRASTTVRFSDQGEGSPKQNDRASHFTNIPTQGDAIVVKRYKNPYLYHYLRPEAVLSNPVPLNSEAFSPFRASTPEDDSEVREATSRIVHVEIPKLAAAIEQGEVIIVNSRQLVNELHKRGINLRYIGMLRSHLSEREYTVRSFILMEMISRTIKNVLRSRLREVKSLQEEAYHDVLTHFFNMVLGSSKDSDRYWQWSLKIHLLVKYSSHHIFSEEEAHTDHDLREHILSKLALFATMQKHLGVSYKQSTQERFQNDPTLFEQQSPFMPQDIAAVAVHVNTLPYHQRELALLTSEVMGLDDENKLAKEIELGKAMIEAEREIERRKKRRARGFVEGMEKEHEDERFAEPLPDLRLAAARAGPPAVPSVSISVSVSASPSSPSGPSSSVGFGAVSAPGAIAMAPPVRDSERHRGDGVLRVQKFEHRGRQLSWSALRATDEPNNDFYFINKLSGEELVRLQNKRQALYSIVFGDKSLEAAIGLFKLAEAESRVESNTLALELVEKGCDILIARKECPVEIVVGFYYLRGTIYERTQQRYHALRVYLIALNVLEAVYGDARPQGVGMGHPFGLVLCCRLAKLAEEERLFAAAFRYGRRFELLWERFPLPSDNPDLLKFVFGSPDYLLSFGHFIQKELSAEVAGRQDDSIKRATRSWLKQISLFDNWSDVNLSTTMLQHDIFARGQPFYLSKHLLTRNLLAKKRQKRRSRVVQDETLQLKEEAEAAGARRDRPMGRVGRHASIPEPLMRHEVDKGAHRGLSPGRRSESDTNNPDQRQHQHPNGRSDFHLDISSRVCREAAADEQQQQHYHHRHLNDDDCDGDDDDDEGEGEGAPSGAKGGELWTWGMGRNGKYDRLTSNLREPRPLNLPDTQLQLSLSTITSVACSSSHALFTTRSGKVYMLGDKATGQINGSTGATQLHAQPVQGLENHVAVKAACGIGSSLVLTREGRVFLWGSALTSSRDFGTMDLSMPDPNTPALLRSMARHCVVDVSCGGAHTLLVTSTGGLFSFGSGEAGALGHGFFTGDIRAPKQVMALSDVPVVAASAGEYFSLVLAADGAIFSFGRGDKGQLGHQKLKLTGYRSLTPRRVEGDLLNVKVARIAAGHDHSMAVTDNGELYLWGSNEHRKLGFRKKAAFPLPKQMKPKKFAAATPVVGEEGLHAPPVGAPRHVTHIAAGYSHSIAVVDEHNVFTWGSAAWAQLGHGDERQCKRPSLVKLLSGMGRVLQVSATYGQSMVLLHLHRHQRAPLAHDLHSPRTATVHRKVHVDLVAEAAPNLASIRTLLAAEIAQQVKSPLRGHHHHHHHHDDDDTPAAPVAAGTGAAPGSEGAAYHQQQQQRPFFSRLSVRSRLSRFRRCRRLRKKAGGAADEGGDEEEQEEQEMEGGLIYGTPARAQRTASGARKYSTDDAIYTTDDEAYDDEEEEGEEEEEEEEHTMSARRLVSRGLQFEPESSGLTTDDDDDEEEEEAAGSTGTLASPALEEQPRRDSAAAASEEARTGAGAGAGAAAAAAREGGREREREREERRQERRARRARWQSDELSRRRKAGYQQPRGHHDYHDDDYHHQEGGGGGCCSSPRPPPLLEIEPCYLFRIPPAASNPLVSLQWSFQAGNAPFWIGRLRIYLGGQAAPPPPSSSSSSSSSSTTTTTVAGASSSAPSTLDLMLEDTAATFRSSSSSSQQPAAAAAAAVLGSYTLDQTGKLGVPRVAPTNDSRRFFVLYLDPVRSELWGQGAVGLGFAERIDAYEFEELLHGHARNSGESMLKRTVSRSEGAALPHHHHVLVEKAISANGPPTRSSHASESAATAVNPQAATAALHALPLKQAQHQQPDEPLMPRHGRRQHFLQAAEFMAIPTAPDEQEEDSSPAGSATATTTKRGHARPTSDRKRKGLSLPPNMQGWVKHE